MPTASKAIPAGYEGVTPYLVVRNAAAAIEFYKKAFGATELMRYDDDDRIGQRPECADGDGRIADVRAEHGVGCVGGPVRDGAEIVRFDGNCRVAGHSPTLPPTVPRCTETRPETCEHRGVRVLPEPWNRGRSASGAGPCGTSRVRPRAG